MTLPGVWHNDDHLEEEWDYEYDDDETEDFYFTLDLSTHALDALPQGRQEEKNSQTANAKSAGSHDKQSSLQNSANSNSQGHQADPLEIQVLDLHTANPLVKIEDNVYDCYWSTDLGTQFHVAKAGVIDSPRYAGNVLDVIGISQTRLLGRPVTLQARDGYMRETSTAATPEHLDDVNYSSDIGTEVDDSSNELALPTSNVLPAPGEPLMIPRNLCKNSAGEDEANFLERLSAIKVKKGEFDPIAVYSVKVYNTPSESEQEAIRKQALEEDSAVTKQAKSAKEAPSSETPKKRRRRWINPEADYESAAVKHHKRMYGRSGRVPNEDVRAGLGYQLEGTSQDNESSEKDE